MPSPCCLVHFSGGERPPSAGITLRDLVNAIPLYAIKAGLTEWRRARERLLRPHPEVEGLRI